MGYAICILAVHTNHISIRLRIIDIPSSQFTSEHGASEASGCVPNLAGNWSQPGIFCNPHSTPTDASYGIITMLYRPSLFQLVRSFSSTAQVCKNVSIIGREPIKIPPSVTVTPTPTEVKITGPLGVTAVPLKDYMKIDFPIEDTMKLTVAKSSEKLQRQMWGTTRTLIWNAIIGMTEGFTVPVYLVGVGYRVQLEEDPRGTVDGGNGQRLNMKLGYSHPVFVPIPSHIKAEVPSATKIVLFCKDKHLLGLFSAKIRGYRKPEPYKGKGIFVGTETIRIKSVKKK